MNGLIRFKDGYQPGPRAGPGVARLDATFAKPNFRGRSGPGRAGGALSPRVLSYKGGYDGGACS
jgi:hypothetical protein